MLEISFKSSTSLYIDTVEHKVLCFTPVFHQLILYLEFVVILFFTLFDTEALYDWCL